MLLACGLVLAAACSSDSTSSNAPANVAAAARGGPENTRAALRASCDRYASPRGSRRGTGRRARPLQSLGALVRSLRPGRSAALTPGRYRHRGVVRLERPRTEAVRSVGRSRATIDRGGVGRAWGPRRTDRRTQAHVTRLRVRDPAQDPGRRGGAPRQRHHRGAQHQLRPGRLQPHGVEPVDPGQPDSPLRPHGKARPPDLHGAQPRCGGIASQPAGRRPG